ncbi:HpcH/HpaI aldolase/citrate lyase family protein [Acuticoccus sp. I52.16.1]|uniref:2,4-dihydroxyhept-2-ene-1,7-dioic acid aldolase n=1 Tax=uncultured Rhizobiales bacterium HF4000_32B18 TaxID=710780 RepID=E0XWC2_9HYPH|nr:aldolase/citrate lyase family protein [Acuticoccus sp. I52.16.1]ADI18713.1 2,4-dihydroxyhept-2-ene-1,7-dioic acid aldolase [uncultured Rhizobiales bacterium HF4000_32B18]UOM37354.1 aldolase/citrate lyase family protein [Acuticoccus sp. I52.16.1]
MPHSRSLKRRLAAKDLLFGSWNQLGYPQTTEIQARAAFDFCAIDMEHTSIGTHELLNSIQISQLAGQPVLVRVSGHDPLYAKRALDAGADGIICPMVETVEQAERARDSVYYAPRGSRGVGLARAQGFGLDFDGYRDASDDELVLIVQIEHWRGAENLEKILDVDGVDGFLVGPYDLSASFGKPGKFDDPDVAAALSRIGSIVKEHDKPSGLHVVHPDRENLKKRVAEGYRFIAYGTDMLLFARAVAETTDHFAELRAQDPAA